MSASGNRQLWTEPDIIAVDDLYRKHGQDRLPNR